MNNVIDKIESRSLEKGISQGIQVLVKTLKELGQENDFIIQKIMENFSLSEDEAKKYL